MLLTLVAAIVRVTIEPDTHLAQIIGALSFVNAAVTGLIGVIGAFRSKAPASDASKPTSRDADDPK